MTEFHLFLPQMRMDVPTLVERARAAERAGFDGMALMDHLVPPGADDHDTHDAMITAAWLAAHTETLVLGHLVLCDAFRHPAVLAKAAVTLDHASGGRFELGLGWGSYLPEFTRFGMGTTEPRPRFDRMAETVAVVQRLWSGEAFSHDGAHHHLVDAAQRPLPTRPIPLIVGGAGPRTVALAAERATWWNCPVQALHRFDELAPRVAPARPSLQIMVALVPDGARRREVEDVTARRYGRNRPDIVLGTTSEIADAFAVWCDRGVERFYPWFCDFGPPETLEAFGAEVITALR